ncbi:pyruvate ferredoxin oxidoreductase [Candidatus Bathyarchaeota archaeon]|nr:pyruvate ferredoxin oxidoreductase [Candidatus Bathyarchaeota archaeon]
MLPPPEGKTQDLVGFTGDEAAAFAAKQCSVDVVAAYPITPQTIIVERFSDYVFNGEVQTEFVCVESEHSAMSACLGASAVGARVFTATSSQGLALMHEVLYVASGMRFPIVMVTANRALSAPLNIHGDHQDTMGSRDCGWIQIFVENAQEVYDWIPQAFKIAEDNNVQLPVAVNLDGFTLTHCLEDLHILKDEDVTKFVSVRRPSFKLDPSNPITLGGLSLPEYYSEVKRQQAEAMTKSVSVVDKVNREYQQISGREYGIIETFEMDDAEVAILCMGSVCGTVRSVVKQIRKEGKKVGLIKLCLYRPFPAEEIAAVTKKLKALAIIDRTVSFGAPAGPLCSDIAMSLRKTESQLKIFDVVCGLGGRDISSIEVEKIFNEAFKVSKTGVVKENVLFVGVRE